jgi:hypothetical protein
MDSSQKALLDQAAEIVKNANAQSWSSGLVALVFLIMVGLGIIMMKWFINSKSKTDAESLMREQKFESKINEISEFARTTLVDLQLKSTEAMNRVAHAMEGCLARQNTNNK